VTPLGTIAGVMLAAGLLATAFANPAAADDAAAAGPATDGEVTLLLSRLDLERPGFARVKALKDAPPEAAEALLAYYRSRTGVKHPVDRAGRNEAKGKYAGRYDVAVADDALKNVLITSGAYPRHDFGPDIDWFTNACPKKDNEWLWQLHRHSSWRRLARAYWHTGDEKYAKAYVRQLRDWVRSCPPPRKTGRPSAAWRTIEAGIRGYSWTDHFQHFVDSPSFTGRDLVLFMNSCFDHAQYLSAGRSFRRGNWGLMEAEGTAFIAFLFPEFKRAAEWREKSLAHLAADIKKQVCPDGHQIEQCLNYHSGCIGWFTRTAELAKMNGVEDAFPSEFWKRLEKMCEVFMKLGLPDGASAQFGDTSSTVHWRRKLLKWAGFFEREDMLYAATGGKEGEPPAATAFALKSSGFYSMRSGWDGNAVCLVLKCGADGGWHCQPENGTFELYAAGRRLMPDSGTYIYHGDAKARAAREWFRQTKVHQTLTLGGKNSAYAAKLLLWKPGDDLDTLVVENRSYKSLTHRRAVLFVKKKFFVIVDEALGDGAGEVDLHFQLAPCKPVVSKGTPSFRTAFEKGANVLIRGMKQQGVKLEEEEGWVSYKYGKRQRRPAFRFALAKGAGTPGVRFVTLVVPYDAARPPATEVSIVGTPKPGARRVALDVRVGGLRERIAYDLGKAPR